MGTHFVRALIAIAGSLILMCGTAWTQSPDSNAAKAKKSTPQKFSAKQIRAGAAIFERNCAPCHGEHMVDPGGAFDLRAFPRDQHDRFINSVTNGKNSMPPWGGALKPDEIEDLWAYVVAGEKGNGKNSSTK